MVVASHECGWRDGLVAPKAVEFNADTSGYKGDYMVRQSTSGQKARELLLRLSATSGMKQER